MARVDNINTVVQREVADYVFLSPNATMYFLEDTQRQRYAVVAVPHQRTLKSLVIVMSCIVNNYVVIEVDTTDKPLYEELMRAGIPRELIVLAYAGEELPAA
jgi:hypothetical protein